MGRARKDEVPKGHSEGTGMREISGDEARITGSRKGTITNKSTLQRIKESSPASVVKNKLKEGKKITSTDVRMMGRYAGGKK